MSDRRRRQSHELERLSTQMEDIFQSMLVTTRSVQYRIKNGVARGWRPSIDVYESDRVLHVIAELAGVSEDKIEVSLDNGMLAIRGERSPLAGDRPRSVHEMGILYGPFAADVYLPYAVDPESVEAVFELGLLHIRLKQVEPTRISISREDS